MFMLLNSAILTGSEPSSNEGVDVNIKSGEWTALGRAAQGDSIEIVRFLIERGADLDIRMDRGWSYFSRQWQCPKLGF